MTGIDKLREENNRLRYVLEGVRGAIDTGRNEPLVIWRGQIDIALAAAPQPAPAVSRAMIDAAYNALPPDACETIVEGEMERVLMAALRAASPQTTPADREAMARFIFDAADYMPSHMSRTIADALLGKYNVTEKRP